MYANLSITLTILFLNMKFTTHSDRLTDRYKMAEETNRWTDRHLKGQADGEMERISNEKKERW
jgi:hypothetical protein